jgi:hypothetical protein
MELIIVMCWSIWTERMPDFSEMKTLRLKIVKQCSRQKFLWSFIGTRKSMLQIWSTRFTLLYSLYSFYFFWAFVIKLYFLFLYIIISRGQSPPIPLKKQHATRELDLMLQACMSKDQTILNEHEDRVS